MVTEEGADVTGLSPLAWRGFGVAHELLTPSAMAGFFIAHPARQRHPGGIRKPGATIPFVFHQNFTRT